MGLQIGKTDACLLVWGFFCGATAVQLHEQMDCQEEQICIEVLQENKFHVLLAKTKGVGTASES